MRILVIEDEKDVAESIQDMLCDTYVVDLAFSGEDGLFQVQVTDYDLILLDYVLPDIDGAQVCQSIRDAGIVTPILFLTGKYMIRDKITALDSGADDYLTKPFSSKELLARIRALLRRTQSYWHNTLAMDDLRVDTQKRVVTRGDRRINLRRKGFDLLEYLIRNQNRVVTRNMILEHVWEYGIDELSNTVDVHIKYLREKIDRPFGSKFIKTIHGMGYTMTNDIDT
ncbi:hypothetical protein A3B02_00620 [Candidatus Roizmanbacteria bacterium RIFCSPLOWO2_01_FULL_42_14]|uniref:DNA-binding response regulator n=3 Tax=Candidatus Roizmaniibacteriota TaxID=1752723 RepID=A0A1F7K047_9BACT|nr:MAG: hypothetical protein A3D08_01830 [Candidatus Roizmanbacteria bacterium RIFCSPHIGHO2_02_FULL_43_11]OGK52272.1 MAG: hypothetical protein A3B02_00620 [Candidatus Roizmanbacteria bacterium RIFCSPLOWO2_01_FULL_42_14]OGK61227.1 MAG: hypothetical protein A3I56_04020 [Candidatus Roizmanbacteria bacterium RIFCSPLOWO2_02_FULL_43_10]